MQKKTDQSYGVVPVCKQNDQWQILLIQQIGRKGDRYWTFPKGHPEAHESPTDTALRELQEETGVTDVFLNEDALFTTGYTFVHEGVQIDKRVDYYLGFVHDPATTITQPHEVAEIVWCTLAEADVQLTHQNMRDVLKDVIAYIDERA